MISSLCHDVLIAGGGPAGATLAIELAQAGQGAVLIERSREAQHKVCGEFLSPESLPLLRRIGIHPVALGAQTIHSLRIAARDVLAEVVLPAPALALTRYTLDEALLQRARQTGASLLRGYTVEQLAPLRERDLRGGWQARITDVSHASMEIQGREAFLATGKHDLRGWARAADGAQNTLVALKMYFVLTREQQAELAGHVELILYPGGYAGLQPVEDGRANLCALITRKKLQQVGGGWGRLLEHMMRSSPHLARRLSGAVPLLERPLALSSIPYGYHAQELYEGPTPWRIGDQAAVIPSFCGDGMAIALHTAHRAAELYLEGATPAVFHEEIRRRFARRLTFATALSRLVIRMPALVHVVRLWPPVLAEIFAATRVPGTTLHAIGD